MSADSGPTGCTTVIDLGHGLGRMTILRPPGASGITPASCIALRAIAEHQDLLRGTGIDWGCGTGCLAIAAARASNVAKVIGLEISMTDVDAARENAAANGVADSVAVLHSDSYSPISEADRARLESLAGTVDFVLANPPASEDGDGFGYRRMVLQGAPGYLGERGLVFLNVSYQYGPARIERLCAEAPGFAHGGVLASTDWVPFDLHRPDLLRCLELYAAEERRGGSQYHFGAPEAAGERRMNARAALGHFRCTGQSPLSKWQTHLFRYAR